MGKRSKRNDNGGIPAKNKKAKVSTMKDTSSPKTISKGSSKEDKIKEIDAKILNVMLTYHMEGKNNATVEDVANDLNVHPRNKPFRERWTHLKNTRNLIGKSDSGDGLSLTKLGLDEAATPEYKEMMKELAIVPKTNSEHQERIKKHLKKKKSVAIFDFLLRYGALSNSELSALVGQNCRSHAYHYSLQELRVRGYVEVDPNYSGKGKKFRLSDKAFKSKDDRPSEDNIDKKELADTLTIGRNKIESQKQGPRSGKKNDVKEEVVKKEAVKREAIDDANDEDSEPNEGAKNGKKNTKKKHRSRDLAEYSIKIELDEKDLERLYNIDEKTNKAVTAKKSVFDGIISADSDNGRDSNSVHSTSGNSSTDDNSNSLKAGIKSGEKNLLSKRNTSDGEEIAKENFGFYQ